MSFVETIPLFVQISCKLFTENIKNIRIACHWALICLRLCGGHELYFLLRHFIFIIYMGKEYYALQRVINNRFGLIQWAVSLWRCHNGRLKLALCLFVEIGNGKVTNRSRCMLSSIGHINISLCTWNNLLIKYVAQINPVIDSSHSSKLLGSNFMPSKTDHLSRWRWIQSLLNNPSRLCLIRRFPIEISFLSYRRLLWGDYEFAALGLPSIIIYPFNLCWCLWRRHFPIVHGVAVLCFLLRLYLR